MIVRLRAVFYPLVQYLSFFFEEFPERSWTVVAFPCFTVDKSFTSWYALLQLFFLRLSSISLHCTSIQFSFAFCVRSGKNTFQDTVRRGRRQGRQKKRWEDNIIEWTGLEFVKSQRPVEKRTKWEKLVLKSSVVPQQPPWLRGW